MKTYEITYKPGITWTYEIINPANEFDIRNMERTILVADNETYKTTVKASSKQLATIELALEVFRSNMGHGYDRDIALAAVKGIQPIKVV